MFELFAASKTRKFYTGEVQNTFTNISCVALQTLHRNATILRDYTDAHTKSSKDHADPDTCYTLKVEVVEVATVSRYMSTKAHEFVQNVLAKLSRINAT